MISITFWRIWFEFLSLLKLIGIRGPTIYYFAFGANMSPSVLKKRRMSVYQRTFTWLDDFEIAFIHEVPFEKCGFASIFPKKGSTIPGTILKIPKIDELRMDCLEGCFLLQRHKKGWTNVNGLPVYYYYSNRPLNGLMPTQTYIDKMIDGYQAYLSPEHFFIQRLKNTEMLTQMKPKRPPRFLLTHYNALGPLFKYFLIAYDKWCMKYYAFLIWRPSVFQYWLPYQIPAEEMTQNIH